VFQRLDYATKAELYLRYKAGDELGEEAARLGLKLSTLERRLREFGAAQVPTSKQPRFDSPPHIEGSALILADPHCPYHDADFVNRVLDIALAGRVEHCVIAGDLLDMNAFSPFDANSNAHFEQDCEEAEGFTEALASAFRSVLWIKGNHEGRLDKRIGLHQLADGRVKRLVSLTDKVVYTGYYFCYVDDWMIAHPKNVSVIAGRVAAQLAGKYRCNVVAGHGHLWGMAPDVSGRYLGIDSGACADPLRLEYNAMRPNTRPMMVQGAVILRDGYPWPLSPHMDLRGMRLAMRKLAA
jgi:predicted phosphodiesterase